MVISSLVKGMFAQSYDGRVAKWLERLTAEQNIDGSRRTLGS